MPAAFSQIPHNLRVPLFYGEIDASLANTAGAETERALIVGPAIYNAAGGAGQAAGQHLARVESAGQAAEIFGANSGAALMAAAYFANDPRGEVWILGHSVNNATASTWSFDGPGGNLAAAIALRVEFAGQEVVVNLDAGTTPADAATAMAQAFPVGGNFPLSCAAAGADIKFTATQDGGYFDAGDLTLEVVGGGAAPFDSLVFARGGGQVLGEDDFTDALGDEVFDAVILPSSDFIPGAQAFLEGRWNALSALYGHAWTAAKGARDDLIALNPDGQNQHITLFGFPAAARATAMEYAAACAGVCFRELRADPARPTQGLPVRGVAAPPTGAAFPFDTLNALLNAGIAVCDQRGEATMIVREATMWTGDAYRDANTLYTLARYMRTLKAGIVGKYGRAKLRADGERVKSGQNIVTPSILRAEIVGHYRAQVEAGLVEDAANFADSLRVEINEADGNRVDVVMEPDLINQLRIFAVLARFRLNR